MTNAQQYIARLTTKLNITEGAAREMTAQRAEDARNSAPADERAHDLDADSHIRYVTQHERGSWFILDSVGLRADSHGYSDLNDALNWVVYGEGYKAVTGREPSSIHPWNWPAS